MVPARSFSRSPLRAFKRARGGTRKLPPSIDFLRYEIRHDLLHAIAAEAVKTGASANDILIGRGILTEAEYYGRLAATLDVDLLGGEGAFADGADWRAALRTGVIRLQDGRWLMAPRGEAVTELLRRVTTQRIAIATPIDYERCVFARFAGEIAAEAAEHLPRTRPDLCARARRNADSQRSRTRVGLLLLAALFFAEEVWLFGSLALAGLMCVAVGMRILATLVGLAPERRCGSLPDADLPFYSVLVALYDESAVAVRLVEAMTALDYPRAKHEVIFIVEEDDVSTRAALEAQRLPPHVRLIVAPAGTPRTKPRALNVGLLAARGDLLVVYDAEDRPDPNQLRKAAARFHHAAPDLAVLQAALRIENRSDSWLTKLFAIDYAVQFELMLPGLARLGAPLPLGGTSNHFRTHVLRAVGGWDAWNVTEDADLGVRLARFGYRLGTLDSITYEEAPPTLRDWFPQRRRWLKGWMQTLVTHTRQPARLCRDLGFGRTTHVVALLAANTFGPAVGLWITLYVLHESLMGEFLARDHGPWSQAVWVWAGLASVGAVSIVLPTCLAIVRGRLWGCAPALLVRPLHWLCVSAAAVQAGCELWASPHHWSKTRHGLARGAPEAQRALVIEVASMPKSSSAAS